MEELYSAAQNFGLVITNESTELHDDPDLNIEICVKIGNELVCTFDGYGNCLYSIFN